MNEDAALETVAALLDSLEAWDGEGRMADHLCVRQSDLHVALQTLSGESSRGMIAEVLVDKAVAAFAPHLQRFQQTLCSGATDDEVQPALLCLRDHFDDFSPLVTGWCTRLGVPDAALMFAVNIRCRILQANLLSGEVPPGKAHLIAFLRQHCRTLLRSGGAAAAAASVSSEDSSTVQLFGHLARKNMARCDPVFSALHHLTLSEVAELKSLWHELLEESIVEHVDEALEDEVYSEYKLAALLQWEETAITSFVHVALPSADVVPSGGGISPGASTGSRLGGFDAFARSEKESWCSEMRQKLLSCYTRRRLAPLWDILAEYPDSVPALVDVRYCLEASQDDALKHQLIARLKRLLATRLHRAGTRTEDILAMLIKAIHSLGVLLSRNDQNTVILTVVGDTLVHLHKRKDSVAAIVQVITQWSGDGEAGHGDAALAESGLPTAAAYTASSTFGGTGGGRPAPSVAIAGGASRGAHHHQQQQQHATSGAHAEEDAEGGGDVADSLRSGARGRPDILRVLLSAIPLKSLVQEYQRVLAQQLLSKAMGNFDTTPEEEVLERLKCTFGEEPLSQCVVMIRDVQMSRRLSQQLREMCGVTSSTRQSRGGAKEKQPLPPPLTVPEGLGVDVLSLTAWPPLQRAAPTASATTTTAAAAEAATSLAVVVSPDKFTPHPALQGEMDRVAELYKQLRANRRLVWLLPESRVKIDVWQRDTSKTAAEAVPVEYELSVFVASLVLFLRELTSAASDGPAARVSVAALAKCVNVTVEQVTPHVQMWAPKLFVLSPSTAASNTPTIALQTSIVQSETFAFEEAEAAATTKEEAIGFPPEQLKLYERLLKTMIKTQGPKSANEVFNSIKIVGGFTGTLADAKKLLQHFVSLNVLAMNDAKLYTLP